MYSELIETERRIHMLVNHPITGSDNKLSFVRRQAIIYGFFKIDILNGRRYS